MSQENVAVVLESVDAVNRRDADAFIAGLHPNVVWEASGDRFPDFRGVYRGPAEVRRWFKDAVGGPWEGSYTHVEEITEVSNDRVLLGLLLTARATTSGVDTSLRMWQVLWFSDGKVIRRRGPYMTREEAVNAGGLPE